MLVDRCPHRRQRGEGFVAGESVADEERSEPSATAERSMK